MKKLITNQKAELMKKDGGYFYRLEKAKFPSEHQTLLEMKLLEEVAEYLRTNEDDELDDIIRVCQALKREDASFSEGWILTNE